MALMFLVFVGSILVIVFSAMKSTDVYKEALARAKANSAVIEALGSPIEDGFLVSGNTNVNGASGESNLAIPISGPKGKGTIYVSAHKSLGQWNYSGLVVEVGQTRERIDLLHEPASSNSN
jgi:hypothetical protein